MRILEGGNSMGKKVLKKVVAKLAKAPKAVKVKEPTAASIVLGLFGLKVVPCDADIIKAVQGGITETKFSKTHLAWYKYQYRTGRWNDGEPQVIRQPIEAPKEVATKKTVKKAGNKPVTKRAPKAVAAAVAVDADEETED